ncbi:MAG: protein-L-isoaspartate(D-aspartate) O-methyltransferase [Caldimonas sp.]
MNDDSTAEARERMVEAHLVARGIRDAAVLGAMRRVPREEFVDVALRSSAYDDTPLPIEDGQTISQPYIVALMLEAAQIARTDRVLEVGAGSGYASAVASRLAGHIEAVERHPRLAALARDRLQRLGYDNVAVHCGDGSVGWPAGAPYDAILVAASGPRVPETLLEQLAIGGRLVMPVGAELFAQRLVQVVREGRAAWREVDLGGVLFVPLVGAQGWSEG